MVGEEMKDNFAAALALVLQHEGGYVNDALDPGGATNKGVTQRVYDDWRRTQGMDPRAVRGISANEVSAIYRSLYWNRVRGDDLPSGVDYSVFDLAVNSGVDRAIRFLQRAVGADQDGKFGPRTLALVRANSPAEVAKAVNAYRLAFLKQLPTFAHFGTGWSRRVAEVDAKCGEMCA